MVENSLNGITNSDIIHKKIDIDSSNKETILHETDELFGTSNKIQIIEEDSEDDFEALEELDRIENEYLNKNKKKKIQLKNYVEEYKNVEINSSNIMDFIYIGSKKKLPFNITHNRDGTVNKEVEKIIQKKNTPEIESEALTPLSKSSKSLVSAKRKIIESDNDEKEEIQKPTESFTKKKLFQPSIPKIIQPKEEKKIETEMEIEDLPLTPPAKKKKFFNDVKTPTKKSTVQDSKDNMFDFEKYSFSPKKISPLQQAKNERLARLHKFKEKPKTKITIPKEYQKDLDL